MQSIKFYCDFENSSYVWWQSTRVHWNFSGKKIFWSVVIPSMANNWITGMLHIQVKSFPTQWKVLNYYIIIVRRVNCDLTSNTLY